MEKRHLDIFTELIKIDAVSGAELPVARYIEQFFTRLDIKSRTDSAFEETKGNSGNVIVEIGGGGEFFLAAHMDTPRSTLGVAPQFLEDRITSDGTTILGVDDRGGLSAILFAAERALLEGRIKPCTLLFTVCEETTLGGSKYFCPGENLRYGYIFDSHMRPGNFVSETCGAMRFTFTFRGKAAHAGISPEKGVNAIQLASAAIARFPFGWINENSNANIGIVNSGRATNVVSDEYIAIGELRTDSVEFGEEKINSVAREFGEIAAGMGGSVEFGYEWEFLPYKVRENEIPYQRLLSAYKREGLEAKGVKSMGGSDANSFNAKGLKVINLGVGAQNPHGNDEFVLYEDLSASARIAYTLITG